MFPLFFVYFIFFLIPFIHSLNPEVQILHQTKLTLSDPTNSLSSWSFLHSPSPCNFTFVTCSPHSPHSITSINLSSLDIAGPFPITLCNLTSLTSLSLSNNSFNSTLPNQISTCRNLRFLNISQNLFVGTLPESLPEIPNLITLDLSGNNFTGEIPSSYGRFEKLEGISLVDNLFNGVFPSFFGNVTTLKEVNLTNNGFKPSQLGVMLGELRNLEVFWASQCNLVGEIPDSFSGLKKLVDLDLSNNRLSGSFPSFITQFSNLVQVELFHNGFTGELPSTGWRNMKNLRLFDASMNELTGSIPNELTQLSLASLNLYQNKLSGEIPPSVADSPNLYELKLFGNRLTGELPRKLGLNSPLQLIDVTSNSLTGDIPPNLCAKGSLEELLLLHNSFSGQIPISLSHCRTLFRVRLSENGLSGSVPSGFWGLPQLSYLELSQNSLSGSISKSIGLASNLSQLIISGNNFTGKIPEELGLLTNLVSISAGDNHFTGQLPSSIVKLEKLGVLDLHNNHLSGEIPSGIKSLKKVNEINLGNNEFSGQIPGEIGSLYTLNYLDLSGNQFSGEVPLELQNLKLNQLNLSNNHLTGDLPPFLANDMYKNSFLGNPGLCGDISRMCGNSVEVKKQGYLWVLRLIFVLAGVILIIGLVWFYYKYRNFRQINRTIDRSKWTLTSFHKLGFSEYEILDCLDEDNVIGAGGSGKVYKAILSNGETVAVKKLWGCSNDKLIDVGGNNGDVEKGQIQDDGFDAEVETLGKIRHKNIVRLWCCCKTKDCKLLVYEYMPNGSLGDLLHSPKSGLLDWPTRYKIALDAAEGLSYLHHDCVPPIVHRDVKSNNILLDGNFGAKVADFGLAKVVEAVGKGAKSMSIVAGSCGYIAPEYAYTLRVNEKSDTYSFGVVILELVTGKRPVDPEYGEKDLVKWVCSIMEQKGVDHVIDPNLDVCYKDEICKVLSIGLLCASPLPINRPSMRRVVRVLYEVRGENQPKLGSKDGTLTPYYHVDACDDDGSVVV